jgi:hypothetical protein
VHHPLSKSKIESYLVLTKISKNRAPVMPHFHVFNRARIHQLRRRLTDAYKSIAGTMP